MDQTYKHLHLQFLVLDLHYHLLHLHHLHLLMMNLDLGLIRHCFLVVEKLVEYFLLLQYLMVQYYYKHRLPNLLLVDLMNYLHYLHL